MHDNPYQSPAGQLPGTPPPSSKRATSKRPRPLEVDLAIALLWVSLLVGGLSYLGDVVGLRTRWPAVFVAGAVLAIMALFVWLIGSGRNWARVLFLILFIVGLPGSLLMLPTVFGTSFILGGLSILQIALQGIALWLLFTDPGARWYRARTAIDHIRDNS